MKFKTLLAGAVAVLTALTFAPSLVQAQGKGLEAAQRGDFVTALREWKPLAEQGVAGAQFNLGIMYYEGQGVPQDYGVALKWYRRAAEQGHAGAQYNLAEMYRGGQGVPQDYGVALKWYRKAAEQGYDPAQSNLGLMYGTGLGVLQDYIKAHMWANIAAAQGNKRAAKNRKIHEEKMTPAQIAEAQKLARECLARDYKRCD